MPSCLLNAVTKIQGGSHLRCGAKQADSCSLEWFIPSGTVRSHRREPELQLLDLRPIADVHRRRRLERIPARAVGGSIGCNGLLITDVISIGT